MNVSDMLLLEEMEESAAEVMLTKLARDEYDRECGIDEFPLYLYTIKHMEGTNKTSFCVVAHGFYWKDRHKHFFIQLPNNKRRDVGSFYCDKKDFISQRSRPVTP